MNNLRALFLDLDDTLCQSSAAWDLGVEAALDLLVSRRPDVPRPDAVEAWEGVNTKLLGRLNAGELSMRQVRDRRFQALLKQLKVEDEDLAGELNDALAHVRLTNIILFDDALPALHCLRSRYHVGIVTNGAGDDHDDSQWSVLRHLGLLDLVDSVWISDEVGFRKPDPRIFEGALEEVGIDPSEAAHVGDSLDKDVAGANAAGMISVLMWRQAGPVLVENADQRPAVVVRSLAALPEALTG